MKTRLIGIILTLVYFNSYAQPDTYHSKIQFKVIKYLNGSVYSEKRDSVETAGLLANKIDLDFFNSHFHIIQYLPEPLINPKYKSETIIIGPDKNDGVNINSAGRETFTYDSLSRLVKYTKSPCIICSFMPFEYNIMYDDLGRADVIINSSMKQSFKIYYDRKGNIKQLDCLLGDKLDERIMRQ
jgi:hypothetical protein